MIKQNFQAASSQGDWTMPFVIDCTKYLGEEGWTDDTLVQFHMAPDGVTTWDDYGLQRETRNPTYRAGWHSYETNSDDGSNAIVLNPNGSVSVTVPASVMSSFGPGMTSLGMHFIRHSTGSRVTLMVGRLPIVSVP